MSRCSLVAAMLLSLALSACANPFARFAPDEAEVVRDGWFDPAPRRALAARYCYSTLGEVDCHAAALPHQESRRVGWFDAPL